MKNDKCCKLISILRTFSKEEYNDFEKIAASPFFSNRRNYVPYIKVLRKGFPSYDGEMYHGENARKYVHRLVNPSTVYNDQYMKNIFSDLIQIAEEALYQKISKNFSFYNQIFLAIEETKRELFHLANRNINSVNQKLNKTGLDEVYFFYKGMNEIACSVLENKIRGLNHETGKPVTSGERFVYFSIILIALSIYNSAARGAMLNINDGENFSVRFGRLIDLEGLQKLLINSNDPDSEVVLIFLYYLLHYYKKPRYSNYKKMREATARNRSRFNPRMLFLICSMLGSVLYEVRDEIDAEKFGREYFYISAFSLKNKCYKVTDSSGFPFVKFRSYYLNAIAIGELEWVEKFANVYSAELSSEVKEETLCLIKANLLFEKGLYDDSFNELRKIKFKHLLSKFDMRVLRMKIFFERGQCLYAENSADAFNKFISNNKKAARVFLDNFITFSKFYKALIDIAHDKVKEPMMVLDAIINSPVFPERRWLLGKIEKFAKLKAHFETVQ
jgi:hypothetical protein